MNPRTSTSAVVALVLLLPTAQGAAADDRAWTVGLRAGLTAADGVPANDVMHYGLAVTRQLGAGHAVGFAYEQLGYDFERPWRVAGVEQDTNVESEDIDAGTDASVISLFYEQALGASGARWTFYWQAGLGIGLHDAETVSGPAQGGGTFRVETEPNTEIIPLLAGGARWNLGAALRADFGVSAHHHLADWKVRDTVSSSTGTVDDYTRLGAQLGLSWRF